MLKRNNKNNLKNFIKTFKKTLDNGNSVCYNRQRSERTKSEMREWRNRQTRTFEGRVVIPYGFKSRLSHQRGFRKESSFFYNAG